MYQRGEAYEGQTLPFVGVRLALKSLLKSGRVRRRLADPSLTRTLTLTLTLTLPLTLTLTLTLTLRRPSRPRCLRRRR